MNLLFAYIYLYIIVAFRKGNVVENVFQLFAQVNENNKSYVALVAWISIKWIAIRLKSPHLISSISKCVMSYGQSMRKGVPEKIQNRFVRNK